MNRPLKIAEMIGRFNWGGAARSAVNLSMGLKELGHHPVCLAIRDDDHFTAGGDFPVELHSLDSEGGAVQNVAGMFRLRRFLRHERIDILHIHSDRSLVFAILALAAIRKSRRVKICYTWHDPRSVLEKGDRFDKLLRFCLSRCDAVFSCSEDIRQRMLKSTNGQVDPVRLHNGIPDIVTSDSVGSDVPTLLWASRFVPSKDPMIFVKACGELKRMGRSFRAVVAGDAHPHLAWYSDQLKEKATELGLNDCVQFVGWKNDLTEFYRSCSIGVQTSHAEGLSMTLLEQMMAGMPVVATDVGGTVEAVEHDRSGIIIPDQDLSELVGALDRLIGDSALRLAMGKNARADALKNFSCLEMAKNAAAVYENICGNVNATAL